MRHVKSEKLKKLELELNDLEQWLKLGLVPKKDLEKHKEEIKGIQTKMDEEKERLQFLKESGDTEEFIAPKRSSNTRGGFTDMPSIPDIDMGDTQANLSTESGFDMDSEGDESGSTQEDDEKTEEETDDTENEDESYFSDKNRWKRGGIIDPDADEW